MSLVRLQAQWSSLGPMMFNAFRGQEQIPPEKKLYLSSEDGETLILPASNILGFLASRMVGRSCVNTFVDAKERPAWVAEILSAVSVAPVEIPLLHNGEKVLFTGEWTGPLYVDLRPAQASKTNRDMVQRPVLRHPWSVEFEYLINETKNITADRLYEWNRRGGILVGICAFRPFFGKFEVTAWNVLSAQE